MPSKLNYRDTEINKQQMSYLYLRNDKILRKKTRSKWEKGTSEIREE